MVVRIRITPVARLNTQLAAGLAGLLTLASVACFSLTLWKILAELGWVGNFFISRGVFSHWQIWIAVAVFTQLVSFWLARPRPLIS